MSVPYGRDRRAKKKVLAAKLYRRRCICFPIEGDAHKLEEKAIPRFSSTWERGKKKGIHPTVD